jgi:hypothetical protein
MKNKNDPLCGQSFENCFADLSKKPYYIFVEVN